MVSKPTFGFHQRMNVITNSKPVFPLYSALVCSKCLGNIYTYPPTLTPDIYLHEMIHKHLFFAERRSWHTRNHLCMNGQLSPTRYLYRDGYGYKLKELFYEETCDNVDKSNMILGPRGQNNLQSLGRVCLLPLVHEVLALWEPVPGLPQVE